jgi:hypothetical protein
MRMRWRGRTAALVMASLWALGGSAPALAQPAVNATVREAARQNYREAQAKLDRGDYAGAVVLFEAAEAIVPIPQTKYKIAVCRDKLGQVADAVRWYQAFLDSGPPPEKPEPINDARARLAALRTKPSQLRVVVTPPNAANLVTSVDNGPGQAGAPLLNLGAGHHHVVLQAPGYDPVAFDVDLAAAEAREVRITLNPASAHQPLVVGTLAPPAQPPPAPAPVHRRSDVPAYVLLGLAGAGGIVGIAFGSMALQDKSTFNKTPTVSGANKEQRDAQITDAALGAGLGLAIVGVVLLVTNPRAPVQSGSVPAFITPYAGPTGAGLVGGLRF